MTTKTSVAGNSWTLLASSPTRVILQAELPIEVCLKSTAPASTDSGYLIRAGEIADFNYVSDFSVNVYARSSGKESTVKYDSV